MSKVAIVTGANKGIGLAAVRLLAQRPFDGHIYLTARDETRGRNALRTLKNEVYSKSTVLLFWFTIFNIYTLFIF